MDLPNPPKDTGLRNIIDKLAEFVARNGPEFESITKTKQQGNPKFGFLYGGDYYQYYQWRVSSEQAILKQQGSISQAHISSGNINSDAVQHASWSTGPVQLQQSQPLGMAHLNDTAGTLNSAILKAQLEAINTQQSTLREQIQQSEQNLTAQQGVLMQQQQTQIDEAIVDAQHDALMKQAEEHKVRLSKFENILQPIVEQCTKDSISSGKNWILQQTTDAPKCNVILQYLLKKALVVGAPFTQKLHLIYLVNDVLHHCVRKRANELKNSLENIVIPMFCSGQIQANDEQKNKLTKLLSLWESKANFFDACVISKLKSPISSMQEYKTNLMNTHAALVASITQSTNGTFENYKQQHQKFIHHAGQQIALLESQKQAIIEKQQLLAQQQHLALSGSSTTLGTTVIPNNVIEQNHSHQQHAQTQPRQHTPPQLNPNNPFAKNGGLNNGDGNVAPHSDMGQAAIMNPSQQQQTNSMPNLNLPPPIQPTPSVFGNNPNIDLSSYQNPEPPSTGIFNNQNIHQVQPQKPSDPTSTAGDASNFALPPPNFLIPDLSKPPPGFTNPPAPEIIVAPEEVKPVAPYYELPAGLMVPLIRLEDYEYRPIDPEDLRLPPPIPPSERLISAVDAFYAPPSHDRPLDGECWEKLALYEYYKVKNAARKTKEEDIQSGVRQRSRSPSPIIIEAARMTKIKQRHYRSRSRSRSRSPASNSPVHSETHGKSRKSGGQYSKRSPKRESRSLSPPSPNTLAKRDRSDRDPHKSIHERYRERDRQTSVSPPPSFFGGGVGMYSKPAAEGIEESNKGHQMLMKMGWAGSGTGLGTHGQGIDKPISGGEVRDRQDQFKGVGISLNDPYEKFRKNMGAAFIHRMRSRDTDRKPDNEDAPEP